MKKIDQPGTSTTKLLLFFNLILVVLVLAYFAFIKFAERNDFSVPDLGTLQYTTGNGLLTFDHLSGFYIRDESGSKTVSIYFYISENDLDATTACLSKNDGSSCEKAIAEMRYDILPYGKYISLEEERKHDLEVFGETSNEYSVYEDSQQRMWNVREDKELCIPSSLEDCRVDIDTKDGEYIKAISFFSNFHNSKHDTNYNSDRFWKQIVNSIELK